VSAVSAGAEVLTTECSEVLPVEELSGSDHDQMFALMDVVYEGVTREAFERDLAGKDECIVLRKASGEVAGFSTQRFITLQVDAARVAPLTGDDPAPGLTTLAGLFSGDTVIHPDHWGTPVLFQTFARRYIADDGPPRWWFLVSKGHRTYRIMPTLFQRFWPNRHEPTPDAALAVMTTYAETLYPGDLDDGVLAYHHATDRLRAGVAGISESNLRVPDIAFFAEANPSWALGHDLVCLCELTPDNLRPSMRPMLLGVGRRT
jgi:hypothetical protein